MEDASLLQPLGCPGNLAPIHLDVVVPGGLRLQPQSLQRLHHRFGKALDGDLLRVFLVRNKGVIPISKVMIDRAAAGGAPDDMDLVGLYLLDKAPPRRLSIFHTPPKKFVHFYR